MQTLGQDFSMTDPGDEHTPEESSESLGLPQRVKLGVQRPVPLKDMSSKVRAEDNENNQ